MYTCRRTKQCEQNKTNYLVGVVIQQWMYYLLEGRFHRAAVHKAKHFEKETPVVTWEGYTRAVD